MFVFMRERERESRRKSRAGGEAKVEKGVDFLWCQRGGGLGGPHARKHSFTLAGEIIRGSKELITTVSFLVRTNTAELLEQRKKERDKSK